MKLLLLHLVSCAWMTGLIWVIQVLHYPFFAKIRKSEFTAFHSWHTQRITYLVAPVMFVELITAIALLRSSNFSLFFTSNFIMILLIWLCTAFLSVPIHNKLSLFQDFKKINSLVLTNWPRTILWSLRLGLLLAYVNNTVNSYVIFRN